MTVPYHVILPSVPRVPIVLSIPHCGTDFPDDLRDTYVPELINAPEDTDWYLDRLYGFAPHLGITMISAVFSRWVIDLNRTPDSKPLYADGRIITPLCPTTTFLGRSLYRDGRKEVDAKEVARRRDLYFDPYHNKLQALLNELKSQFGKVLLWDCHSIRQIVPTIQQGKFPDLILGSADGAAADEELIVTALTNLGSRKYSLQHNLLFKGGYITRHYGQPDAQQHALQLEMTKVNYMDDSEREYDPARAERMSAVLENTLNALGMALTKPRG